MITCQHTARVPFAQETLYFAEERLIEANRALKETAVPLRCCAVILPTGVGKTGFAASAPFVVGPHRGAVLLVAPNLEIKKELIKRLSKESDKAFLLKNNLVEPEDLPRVAPEDLDVADWPARLAEYDVFVTNIQALTPKLSRLPRNMFGLLVLDEGRSVAAASIACRPEAAAERA
jgi:reverse gyrase